MILCQRVIHPLLQSHLHSRRVSFIQRLSADSTPFIRRLSGAKLFSSVILPETEVDSLTDRIGRLKAVKKVRLPDEEHYLHLTGYEDGICDPEPFSASSSISSSSIQTFVICSPTEENYLETKSLIETSLSALRSALNSPEFVDGGGCFLSQLQTHLTFDYDSLVDRMKSELGHPTMLLVRRGIDAVTKALRLTLKGLTSTEARLVSVVDGSQGHHWIVDANEEDEASVRCACRRMIGKWTNEEEEVIEVEEFKRTDDDKEILKSGGRIVDSHAVVSDAIGLSFQLAAVLIHTDKVIAAR